MGAVSTRGSGLFAAPPAALLAASLLGSAGALGPAAPVSAAGTVTFDPPTATAVLGRPLVFGDTFRSDVAPERVEVLISTPFVPGTSVEQAAPAPAGGGSWRVSVSQPDTGAVNTVYRVAFRVMLPGGATTTSGTTSATVTDPRFAWQAVSGTTVTLHWYGYSRSQARAWLDVAESAVGRASTAFGVTSVPHVDFFVYSDSQSFFDAVGSGANADAAGVYIADTHTAVGMILPSDIGSSWPDQEIAHEITHHVFAVATQNPYHAPPVWLDEGCAVYYSEGIGPRNSELRQGIAQGTIIPLDGLTGTFPSTTDPFVLSYAEAVSAVDVFLRTYGQPALRTLLRAYRQGATDDEAFTAATHADAAAFDATWLASIGARPPRAYGPRPAPAGPAPPGWSAVPSPAPASALVLAGVGAAFVEWRRRRRAAS